MWRYQNLWVSSASKDPSHSLLLSKLYSPPHAAVSKQSKRWDRSSHSGYGGPGWCKFSVPQQVSYHRKEKKHTSTRYVEQSSAVPASKKKIAWLLGDFICRQEISIPLHFGA